MPVAITLTFSVISIAGIVFALLRPSVRTIFLAAMLLFSFGHYQLPIYFIDRTPLRNAAPEQLNAVLFLNLLFIIMLILGFVIISTFSGQNKNSGNISGFVVINTAIIRYRFLFGPACALFYLMYLIFVETTSYAAANLEDFFLIRSATSGVVGFAANFALAGASVSLVMASRKREWWLAALLAAAFVAILFISMGRGQRLIFLTPVFMILGAFAAQEQYRTAGLVMLGGLVALLVISPFAVTLRETIASDTMRQTQDIDTGFSYGSDPANTILQSVLDRADVIENAISLKLHSDTLGPVPWTYYGSVLAAPIPRSLYPAKPVPLSSDGTLFTEPSVIAWQLKKGDSIGSLTTFGAITAYHEAGRGWGWPWIMANAFLTGASMAYLLSLFSRNGVVGHMFLCMAFVAWSIAKVPPSLFEMLAGLLAWLPVMLLLLLGNACVALIMRGRFRNTLQTQ